MEFKVKANGMFYGEISESMLSFSKELVWKFGGETESDGTQAAISFGDEITIRDCKEMKLASLEERLWSGFGSVMTSYRIVDAYGHTAGYSDKVQWVFTPHFTIKSADGNRILAKIKRPVFSWGDQWQITILKSSLPQDQLAQDPRVLTMLAAFKTASSSSVGKSVVWGLMIGTPLLLCICCGCFIYNICNGAAQGWGNQGEEQIDNSGNGVQQEEYQPYTPYVPQQQEDEQGLLQNVENKEEPRPPPPEEPRPPPYYDAGPQA